MGVHAFPKGIHPKVNVIVELKFKFIDSEAAVQHFNHYVMVTFSWVKSKNSNLIIWLNTVRRFQVFQTPIISKQLNAFK